MKPSSLMSHDERAAAELPCFCKACRPAGAVPITKDQALAYYNAIDRERWLDLRGRGTEYQPQHHEQQ